MPPTAGPAPARGPAFPVNWAARAGWVLLLLYVLYAGSLLDITWDRFAVGVDNG